MRLVRVLTPRELRTRYRQSLLNVWWAVLSPIAILAVYGAVLTQSFGVGSSCGPYLSSAWAGLVVWTFFSTAVGASSASLVQSADLISKLYFPKEALPLAAVGSAFVELTIGVVTLLGLVLAQGVPLQWSTIWGVFALLVLVVWAAAIGVFLAALAAFTRDVIHAVSLGLRVGFFASAIMYEADQLPNSLAWTATVNPVTVVATQLRTALLCGTTPDFTLLILHLAIASACLVAAIVYTRAVESRLVDVV